MNRRRLILLSAVIIVISGVSAFLFWRYSLIPNPSSMEREPIDRLLRIMFSIASVIFVLVMVLLIHTLIFFRRRPGDAADGPPLLGNSRLEILWTVLPLLIVIALGTYGGLELEKMMKMGAPMSALEVKVIAFQWGWQFEYPQYGIRDFTLRLPVDTEVMLRLESRDVIHSFWVPEFGPKQDAVPGMVTELRITPSRVGQYRLECAELCGFGHSFMLAPVEVMPGADFQDWAQKQKEAATMTPTPTPTPPSPTGTPSAITIDLVAENSLFNLNEITVPAGAQVTINFDNRDDMPHNFALYTDSSAQNMLFRGELIMASRTTYTFAAPEEPGTYFFRCDVHPFSMTGDFIVQ